MCHADPKEVVTLIIQADNLELLLELYNEKMSTGLPSSGSVRVTSKEDIFDY